MIRSAVLLLALPPAIAEAQSLSSRVAAVGSGTVRLSFASQDGVCGNGRGSISICRADGRSTYTESATRGRRDEWEDECEPGPVRLALDVSRSMSRAAW